MQHLPNTSITQLARHYESYNGANPKNLKVVVDVPLKSHQSEVGFVLRVLFNYLLRAD